RTFLQRTLVGIGSTSLATRLAASVPLPDNPFTLGIASGDVTATQAVLWTRLAPNPDQANGAMPPVSVAVQWQLALNPDMSTVVQRGQVLTGPAHAHCVHVDLAGLEPGRQYWYQFTTATHRSAIGRTKTLPRDAETVRFVTASCQNYTHGSFVAYRHMVKDDPDFVLHLGDYIYDTAFGEDFRNHESERAPQTLDDFRRRHALYKTDPDLQHAHAQLPFFTTIDNHDAVEDADPASAAKRAAAYQAWHEHMPTRGYRGPGSNQFELQRRIAIGKLLQISLLDARQYRDQKAPCQNGFDPAYGFGNYREYCAVERDPKRSMLGDEQDQWLAESLQANQSVWNVMASPGPFLPFEYQHQGKDLHYIGAWDSYPANRERVAAALRAAPVGHPVVLSGDVHSFWAVDGNLANAPKQRIKVVELITSSISANWPAALAKPVSDNLSHNPQVAYYDPDHRGYMLHDVSAGGWETQTRALNQVTDPHSGIRTLAKVRIQPGKPGFTLKTS
ncbi:MAG: alkaline phosphatase, partial [Pseudomonadales bacterium]